MDPELRIQIKKELAEREEGNKATKDLAYTGCKIKEETLLEAGENGVKKTFLDPMDLYTDHEIKDELVIGPVVVRRPVNGSTNEPKVLVDPLPVDVLARFTRSKANTVLRFKLDGKDKKPNRISKEKYEDASDIRQQGLQNVFVPFDQNEIQKKIIVSFKSRAVEGDMDSEDTSQEKENPAKVLLLSENDHTSGSEDCTTGIKRKSRRGKKRAKKLKKEGSGNEDLSLQIKESLSKVLLLSEGDHSSESEDHAPAIKQKSHREKKKSKKLNNEGNGSGDEDDNGSEHEDSSAENEDLSSDGEDCVPRIKTRSKKNKGSEKDYSEDDDYEEDDVIEESDDDYSQRKSKSKHKKDRKRDRSERTRREKRTRPRYSESSDDQESEAEGTSDSDLDQRLSDDGNQKSASASGSSEQGEDESLLQPKQVKKQIIHLNYCKVCLRGTDLLDCDSCAMAYHRKCVNAPVKKMPAGQFRCPRCSCPPIDGKVAKVLTWRWEESSSRTMARQREFFIKWDQRSYWECSWAGELQMDVYETRLYRSYMRKYDMDEPPELEAPMDERDGRFQRMQRDKAGREPVDEKSLQEKYYRYGVKPEWLMVQRVLSRRNTRPDNEFFLVKWRELSYDQATWESKYEDIPGLKDAIEYYQDMESYLKSSTSKSTRKTRKGRYIDSSDDSDSDTPLRPARPSRYKPPPDEPTTNLSDKYESQPFFVEDTGMQLKPYQLEGLNWLRYSWEQGINTILADEMGLGKTIQTVAFLYSLYKEGHCRGPFLVSVPLSTIINWEREFELWAPDLYCVTYTGAKDLRAAIRKYEFDDNSSKGRKTRTSNSQTKFHVLLTSYEFTSVDVKYLSAINWAVLVVDEAHRLKNNQSKFFRILSGYEIDYKLLLTGTPLQNNLEELFHLLNFLNKKKFKDLDVFQKEFADVAKEEQVKRLHELLGPHMLRRLKADVLKDMPTKSEFIVRVELSPMQKKFCRHILMKNFEALNSKHGGKPVTLLNLVMDLRKCCNHPYLFPLAAEEAPVDSRGNYETQTLIESSGKLVLLTKMLKRLKEQGHRVLIFSQMTRVLNVLEEYLEGLGYRYERIDGNITGIQRQEAIDRFNSADCSHFIFLLSTRAGGLGINLATADTVIIYDSDWNPHNDIQAFSRAHRIGQKNKVMIYRFITRNSVEERMMQVAKKKMMLTHLVVRSDNEQGPKFNKQELDSIVKFGAEELFKEEESKDAIHYDDKAVEELLDRSNAGIEQKESVVNEYFNSFKVANYSTKGENDVDKSKPKQESDKTDPAYWGKLLGRHREDKPKRGVGRPSKHSDYVGDLECKEVLPKDTVYDTDESDSADEDERFDVELHNRKRRLAKQKKSKNVELNNKNKEDAKKNTNLVRKKVDVDRYIRRSKRATVLDKQEDTNTQAELLAGSENNTEVVGFNARQRKAFLHAIMRYGMPPQDSFNTQWLEKDLQCKSERNFRAYSTLFMRHLCEPCADDAKTFADGVPREGLSSRHVLTRIGIMCLIRKKVHEFESSYGIHSMPKSNSSETIVIDDVEDNPASNPPLPIDTHVILDSDEEILPDLVRVSKVGNDKSEPNNNRDIKDKKQMSPEIDDTDNVTNDVDLYSEQQVSVNKDPLKETVTSARDNLVKEKKDLERRTSTEAKAVKDNEAEKDCDRLIGNEERMLLEEGTSKERETSQKDLKLKVDTDKNGIDRRISVDGESLKQNEVDDKSENDLERKVSVDDNNRPEKDCDLENCNQTANCPELVMSTKDDPLKDNDTSQKHCDLDIVEVETCLEQGMSIDSDPLTDNDNVSQKDCDLAKVENCLEQGMSTDADPLTDDTSDDTSQKDCNLEFVAENCLDQEMSIDDDPLKDNDMPQKDCDPKLYKAENCLKQELSNDSDPLKDNDLSPKNCDLELEKTENCLEQGMSIEDDPLEDTTEKDLVLAENSLKQGLIVDDNPKDNASENINPELLKDENVETPKYLFNIADGGFTELHTLWVNEERALVSGKEHATWHRTHDFWLLAGIVVHGYGRWLFLQNDPRFAIINEPFKADSCKTNFIEIRNRFLTRRFKLLEQALVIEEQLRRAAYLNLKQDPNHLAVTRSRLPNVLNQLGDLLSDMKANVSRLPAALARNERVADRLKMSARVLMSRLADNPSPAAQTPKFPPGLGKLEQDISNYGPQYSVPVDGAPPTSD